MSATESGATTAAQGDIADPAKIKADNAAAASSNGAANGDVKANGDGTNGGSPAKKDQEEPVAGPSKSPSKNPMDVVKEAMGYFTAGKRDLLIRDPASAVASLAQACQMLGEHFGETAPECGEPYYYYGRALLDLARMEAGVIDNVLDGVPEDDDSVDDSMVGDPEKCTDEEKEKVGKDVDKALEENYESCEKMKAEKEAKEKAANGSAEKKSNGEAKSEDKTDGNCVAKPETNGKHTPNGKEAKSSPVAAKEVKNGSPSADKALVKETASPAAAKESKSSPAAKEAKASPASKDKEAKSSPAGKDKEAKSSPAAKDKEAKSSSASKDVKSSPKDAKAAASNGKDTDMTSPKNGNGKVASPEVKKGGPTAELKVDNEEMEVEVTSNKKEEETNGHTNKLANGKKESEEDGDSKDGEEEDEAEAEGQEDEDKEEGAEENKENEGAEDDKDDSIQGDEAEKGDVAATEKEDEEEPSNLQLAWEMLELAKNILVKQSETLGEDNKDKKGAVDSRICDTFQTLGELSIENENYPQAIEDLGTCLQRRKEMLPEDSRLIAETHYQLGVAQGFNLDFDRAVDSLNAAISVLAKRVENLKAKTESVDPAKKNDAFYTREGEIKEIESLIPEIKEKIADTNDMKAETQKKLAETRLGLGLPAEGAEEEISTKSSADAAKVSTISTSLIKKRKKSEEEGENGTAGGESGSAEPAKKPREEGAESTKEEDKMQ